MDYTNNKREKTKFKKRIHATRRNLRVAIKDTGRAIKNSKFFRKTIIPLTLVALLCVRIFLKGSISDDVIDALNILLVFLGLLLTIINIEDGRRLQEAEFLVTLNKVFVDNETYTKVYEYLENNLNHKKNKEKLKSSEVSKYLTFFETLYVLVKEHSVTIDEFDDLFGYRFFLAVNDPDIWDIKLKKKKNFQNIYELEYRWFNYRTDRGIPILDHLYEIGEPSILERKSLENEQK